MLGASLNDLISKNSLSVIIPAHNEQAYIRHCIAALVAQVIPVREILVVDNLSDDDTVKEVRQAIADYPTANIKLLHQDTHLGLIPTRNLGFSRAQGDVLGRIDADTRVLPDWSIELLRSINGGAAAATGPVYYYDTPFHLLTRFADDFFRRYMNWRHPEYPFVFGSNMAFTQKAWHSIESNLCRDWEDKFHEDLDIALHLVACGLMIRYNPRMIAGISSRRADDTPEEFVEYLARFNATYAAHGVGVHGLTSLTRMIYRLYEIGHAWRVQHKQGRPVVLIGDTPNQSRMARAVVQLLMQLRRMGGVLGRNGHPPT